MVSTVSSSSASSAKPQSTTVVPNSCTERSSTAATALERSSGQRS